MSARFETIKALMEDPLNLACFLKVWNSRDVTLVSPKLKASKTEVWGWAAFRDIMKLGPKDLPDESSFIMSMFFDGSGWFVVIPGGEEVGPFDTQDQAEDLVRSIAKKRKWLILSEIPW